MPNIVKRCPHCTKPMQFPASIVGKTVKCPSCAESFVTSTDDSVVVPTPPPAQPLVGPVLGRRYRFEKLLSQGWPLTVYLAVDAEENDRHVVVQEMPLGEDRTQSEGWLVPFRRQFEILQSLQQAPAVPRVYDFIEERQAAYLVREFFLGKNLMRILENGQPFPMPQVIEWGKSICEVFEEMHRLDPPLVHGTLTPWDLAITGESQSIKMVDFGGIRPSGQKAVRPAKRSLVFAAGYAPPEHRDGRFEPRGDLYCLAATLFHLATGKHPDDCDPSMKDEVWAALEHPTKSKHEEYRWFFELLGINLAENVDDRCYSAKGFRAALQMQRVTAIPRSEAFDEINAAKWAEMWERREQELLQQQTTLNGIAD